MGWILFGLCLVFVISRIAGEAAKDNDDFAGNSTASYFLLEEFIDKASSEEDEPNQGEIFQEQEVDDWFEVEFE